MIDLPIQDVYRFCPRCGSASSKIGAVPFRCPSCDYTQFFGPVGAVGGLVVNDSDELLLVRRAKNPGLGKWGLPGGFVDHNESIEDALKREVHEETALDVISFDYLASFPNIYRYKGVAIPVIDLFYVCRVATPYQIELDRTELESYHWCRPGQSELNDMAFESNRKAVVAWLDPP
ncbi:NUDIX domain-containing protein [Rubripirellula amarantea]|nr:NUDIX domain-containing protein [Rubripirellula amarantea]MDA8743690.1 NUDIX domain-containing protein [Rubripirellula amarantea]